MSRLPAGRGGRELRPARLGGGPVRQLRLALARYRRPVLLLAVLLLAAPAWRAAHPPAPPTTQVLVAARDLAPGTVLDADALREQAWPGDAVPAGVLHGGEADGRVLAAPMRAGEPLTDVRVLGPGLLAGRPAGTRAVSVRVGDGAGLVEPGSVVDVLAVTMGASDPAASGLGTGDTSGAPTDPPGARTVASAATVLAVPGRGPVPSGDDGLLGGVAPGVGDVTGAGGEALVVLAVDVPTAARLAAAQAGGVLSLALRGGPDRPAVGGPTVSAD